MRHPLDWDRLRRELAPLRAEWEDTVVPAEVEELPTFHYSPEYAWMYAWEKDLKRRLERSLGHPLGSLERTLFGSDGVVSEGLSNAWAHGHRRARTLPIRVRSLASSRGLAFGIRDGGPGFDVETTLDGIRRGDARAHHHAGNGLRALLSNAEVLFDFGCGGKELLLAVLRAG